MALDFPASERVTAADFADQYRQKLGSAIANVDTAAVQHAAEWIADARTRDAQIFVCGNGGSAATASHFATDMVKGASMQNAGRFRIFALTDSLSTMTAYANDVCYDCIFAEQLKNFARKGDVLVAISGSGNSPNVLQAMEYANAIGCRTISMTGRDGGRLAPLAQLDIRAAEQHMGRIEDVHMMVCHMLCYFFIDRANSLEN